MKFLRCKLCAGEVEIVNIDRSINKKIRCLNCNFNNLTEKIQPEIVIIKKRRPTE